MMRYKSSHSPNLRAFNLCLIRPFADITKTPERVLPFSDAENLGFKRLRFPGWSADLSKAHVKPVLPGSGAGRGRGPAVCPRASYQLYPNPPTSPWSGDGKEQEWVLSLEDQKTPQIHNLPSPISGLQELKEQQLYQERLCYKMT